MKPIDKHGFIVIDGISFPTIESNGMFIIEYHNPLSKKLTEESKKNIKKMTELFKEIKKKFNGA